MSITSMNGFELVIPTVDMFDRHTGLTTVETRKFCMFDVPVYPEDWYRGASGVPDLTTGIFVTDVDARIDGQCLQFKRPDAGAHNAYFNGSKDVRLTTNVAAHSITNVGIAVKYSKRPSQAIPLLMFSYDNGVSDNFQTALWIGQNGNLFFGLSPLSDAAVLPITPTPIDNTVTVPGAVVFNRWTYIEISLSLATGASTVSIAVDGKVMLELVTATDLMHYQRPLINRIHVINPMNTYFPDNSYEMFIDDFYTGNGGGADHRYLMGPQHIVHLPIIGATDVTQWTPEHPDNTGANASNVTKKLGETDKDVDPYVYANANGLIDLYDFGTLPPVYTTVNALRFVTEHMITEGAGMIYLRYRNVLQGNLVGEFNIPAQINGTLLYGNVVTESIGASLSVANVNAAQFGVRS